MAALGVSMRRAIVGLVMLLAACHDVTPPGPGLPAPVVLAAAVTANPHNVLSAIVTAEAAGADSLAVLFRLEGAAGDSVTAAIPGSSGEIPVLGLLAEARYLMRVVAFGPGGSSAGDSLWFETGALPASLPSYGAGGSAPSPGFVVFAAAGYVLAIDNTGRVVWYRHFPGGTGLAFMAEPTGHYVLRPPTPDPADREPWLELDALGNVTRTMGCARDRQPRLHDLLPEADGSWWLMCDEVRTMNLSALGGKANAQVTGTTVQHVSATGELLLEWSPFDHFDIADLDSATRSASIVNWTHGNSLDRAADGNILVSFRNLGEITKIDAQTGTVLWRLGGKRSFFVFEGTPAPAFSGQHNVRSCASGVVLLLDNVGDSAASRAERYVIDEPNWTARLDRSMGSTPGVTTLIGGSVQELPGGRTLVSYGTAGRVEEYDASGQVVWQIDGNPGYVFRAQRIRSLYHPGAGSAR